MRAAVFGNVGTLISFPLGHDDAEELAGEFAPYGANSLTGLYRGEVCVRTVMGGMTDEPFFGTTIPEVGWNYGSRTKVIEQSQRPTMGEAERTSHRRMKQQPRGRVRDLRSVCQERPRPQHATRAHLTV